MSFVHNDIAHIHFLDITAEKRGPQALGRNIQELEVSVGRIVQRDIHFPPAHTGIHAESLYAAVVEILDLILHQSDQRSDHYRNPLLHQRRDLKAHGLASSCRQNCKHISALQSSTDDILLLRTERVITPVFLQHFKHV